MTDLIKPRAAYFLDRAGKLGCENWRGPATVKDAAQHIAALEAELALGAGAVILGHV